MEHCVAKEASPHPARLGAYYLTAEFGPVADWQILRTPARKRTFFMRIV